MRTLQDSFDQYLEGLPERLLAEAVAGRLRQRGLKVSDRQARALIRRSLRAYELGSAANSADGAGISELELSDTDIEELQTRASRIIGAMPKVIEQLARRVACQMLPDLKRRWPTERRIIRRRESLFRRRLATRWRRPLDLFRLLLIMCVELGASANIELTLSRAFKRRRHLVDVMRRLHARACQVAAEVLALLEAGFADGAMARWRTLHELAVTTAFIGMHGEKLAKRYVLHQAIESKRAADEYQRCSPLLGYDPLEPSELATIQEEFNIQIARFGKPFGEAYGWASDALKHPRPTFADIERAAKIHRMRSHYKFASYNVHANPRGAFFRLGLLPGTPLLLAGPSNSGLPEPGQCAALSLAQVTTVFATLDATIDNLGALHAIDALVAEVAEAFGAAHTKLLADERRIRAGAVSKGSRR